MEETVTDESDSKPSLVKDLIAKHEVVILLNHGGRWGRAFYKGHHLPFDITIDYGSLKDDQPQTIRRITLRAGWTLPVWRKAPVEVRNSLGDGAAFWRGTGETELDRLLAMAHHHRRELLAHGEHGAFVHPEDLPVNYRPGMKLVEAR